MHNFMLYRLVTDSWEVVGQKLGVWAEKPYKIPFFTEILAGILLRIWVDLLSYTDRRTILYSIDWRQIQGGLWTKNWGFGPKNHIKCIDKLFYVASPCQLAKFMKTY